MKRNLAGIAAAAAIAAGMLAGAAQPAFAQSSAIEQRLEKALRDLGFPDGKLPALKPVFGQGYVHSKQIGNLLYLTTGAPQRPDGTFVKGRVPDQISMADAIIAAKFACVRQVNRMKLALGDLGRVKSIVKLRGLVLAKEGFADHSKITDGCTAFLIEVFGDVGIHTRSTEGMVSMPFDVTFEADILVELHN
jgi:hypothetical protein